MSVWKRLRPLAPVSSLALLVAACTTATPYQPYLPEGASGVHGGYSDRQISPDRYLVRFHGNELTSRDRVEGYLLYRAAELTVQNGYDWFTMVERHTEHDSRTYVRPDPLYRPWYGPGYDYWRPDWHYYRRSHGWGYWHPGLGDPFWADHLDMTTVESFEATAELVMHKAPPPATGQRAFDARKIMTDLGPTIQLPQRR